MSDAVDSRTIPGLFVVRQPVYTRTQHVFGYKIEFEAFEGGEGHDPREVVDAVIEIGFDALVGNRHAFIAMPPRLFLECGAGALPRDRTIVELTGYEAADEALLAAVAELAGRGHLLALADFVLRDPATPLLDLVQFVKLDVESMEERDLARQVRALKRYDHLKLVAGGVQSQEKYAFCRELGMNYFEGHFFARPKAVRQRRLPASRLAVTQLLAALQDPAVAVPKLEAIISKDVALSYKLLRYINSAFFGLPRPVESIQRAIVFLGTKAIQKWATLLALARFDDKPTELMVTAVVRARMCELLAHELGWEGEDIFFTAGLLSVLDAMLDLPMAEVLRHLTLSDELNRALLAREGRAGEVLRCVLSYEASQWCGVGIEGLSCQFIRDAYLDAIGWATGACRMLTVVE